MLHHPSRGAKPQRALKVELDELWFPAKNLTPQTNSQQIPAKASGPQDPPEDGLVKLRLSLHRTVLSMVRCKLHPENSELEENVTGTSDTESFKSGFH